MNIYINKRLFSLPIINQLGNLLNGYNGSEKMVSSNSLNSYKDWLCQDPVATFLDYVIEDGDDTKQDRVRYLTERFYISKGTGFVIKELKNNKNLKVTFNSLELVDKKIKVNINELPDTLDFDNFCLKMVDFFSALLFFNDIEINIETAKLKIVDELKPNYAIGKEEYEYDIWKDSQS